MSEPLTKAEMVERYKAARARMTAAGIEQTDREEVRRTSVRRLRFESFVARAKSHKEEQEQRKQQASDQIAKAFSYGLKAEAIIAAVCHHSGLLKHELIGPSRFKHIVYWRQLAMFLVKAHTLMTWPMIGKRFGGRDHATALHSIRMANKRAKPEDIAAIERLLSPP